jgi:hypothetical protein
MIQDTRTFDISPKSDQIKFRGKVTWAQLIDPNKFGNWSLNLYPEPDSLERLRELTLKNVFKKDDDGYYLQISRQTNVEFVKGVQTGLTPPKLQMKDGSPVTERIGDGSICEVTCELRKYKVPNSEKWGNAIRLYRVTVEELVPSQYKKDEGWDGKTS